MFFWDVCLSLIMSLSGSPVSIIRLQIYLDKTYYTFFVFPSLTQTKTWPLLKTKTCACGSSLATQEAEIRKLTTPSQTGQINSSPDCISKIPNIRWAPVAHYYNPSYSGGRDQEDHNSKSVWANSSWDPTWKTSITKKASGMALG
jgi:hypothetical protein